MCVCARARVLHSLRFLFYSAFVAIRPLPPPGLNHQKHYPPPCLNRTQGTREKKEKTEMYNALHTRARTHT